MSLSFLGYLYLQDEDGAATFLRPSNQAGGRKDVALLSQREALRFITVWLRVVAGLVEVMSGHMS